MTDGELLSLHRYYIWANRMREHFDDELQRKGQAELDRAIREGHVDVDVLMYMSLWYGTLYVVIEGWRRLGLTDPEIDRLLESSDVDNLRLYRNGTFHFQPDYWSEKLLRLMRQGAESVAWVRQLNTALGRYLLTTLQQRSETSGS